MQYLALIGVYIDSFNFAFCIVLSFETYGNLILNKNVGLQGKNSIIWDYFKIFENQQTIFYSTAVEVEYQKKQK